MKAALVLLIIIAVSVAAVAVVGAGNQGAENIKIYGGSKGNILFPHHAHQDQLQDCNTCHSVFPQEADSIKKLKDSDQLKKKQVMNKQCIKCHRDEKKAGNPSGPTTCSKCHVKG
ncbi:MAG: cytochrome c3 family protein [Deltaproteobacteria bacterium]|nr:cytochrome c3 family protein [Deltaproteobacteria bacterium]MBW2176547.1 cytochrome c3 family protein [Deltaproteobacteria bacterium]MBW2613886.1 cytochrome c3 family protein [Deltaproteobacteria bacterium]MBW2676917.1 cytochrome c3 family protein [Deltaproteobacteria bacterium]